MGSIFLTRDFNSKSLRIAVPNIMISLNNNFSDRGY
jgi:hypothetical protein